MKYLAAYLLLNAAGSEPSKDNVSKVLESVGIEVDGERVDALLAAVDGKAIDELVAEGNEKLSSVPAASGSAAAGDAGAAAGGAGGAAEEAKEEEANEESDDDMGFGLFD